MSTRYETVIAAIDEQNAQDPGRATWQDREYPVELLYGYRMTEELERFSPQASEHLRIAARAQHIRRWDISRDSFPPDRKGYHLWRARLYAHHAEVAGRLMRDDGYAQSDIERVRDLVMKKRIKSDPESQTLEDVACLVFLRWYYEPFIRDYDDEKVVAILRRTWKKMSDAGHAAALALPLHGRALALVQQALAPGDSPHDSESESA